MWASTVPISGSIIMDNKGYIGVGVNPNDRFGIKYKKQNKGFPWGSPIYFLAIKPKTLLSEKD